jgi:hypothetical protein
MLHLGQLLARQGDRDAARKDLSSAMAEFRGIGDQHGTVFALLALSAVALGDADLTEAGRLAAGALREPVMGQLDAAREHAKLLAAGKAKGGAGK